MNNCRQTVLLLVGCLCFASARADVLNVVALGA